MNQLCMGTGEEATAEEDADNAGRQDRASTGRRVALVVITLVLAASVAGTVVVFASHQTLLSAEFAKDTAGDTGVYGQFENEIITRVSRDIEDGSNPDDPFAPTFDPEAVAETAVTPEFVRAQLDANIDRYYRYLHGGRETLDLYFDTEQLRVNLGDEIGKAARDIDLAAVVDEATAGIGTEIRDTGVEVPLNGETFERMAASETSYNEERKQFRTELRAVALDRTVEEGEPAELLALIDENPEQYDEAERRRIVDEREEEIKRELAETEKFQTEFEESLEKERKEVVERIEAEVDRQKVDRSDAVARAVGELLVAMVDGLFTDQPYGEFVDRVEQVDRELSDEAERRTRERIDENIPERIGLAEEMDQEGVDQMASYVQVSETIGWALLLLSLGLVAGSYALSRSAVATLTTVGSGVSAAGLGLLVGAVAGGDWYVSQLRASLEDGGDPMGEFTVGLLDGTFSFVATVSLLVLGCGVVLLGVGFAIHGEYIEPSEWR